MKSLSSWLIVFFMIFFWLFRVIVAFEAQYEKDFGGFIAFNYTIEIILLFVAILCMILVLRRMLIRWYNISNCIWILFWRIYFI